MSDTDLLADVAQLHALAAKIAVGVSSETSGVVAVEALVEVFAAVRQGELATVRLIERADRTGEYRVDGARSITAFVRITANETDAWAIKRVHVGRGLADRLPETAKAWEAGTLGLDHANVIEQVTQHVDDPQVTGEMDRCLAGLAATVTPTLLARAADDLKSQALPEDTEAENAKKRAAQHLHLSQTTDGMFRLDGWFDAEAGMILQAAINGFLRKRDPDGDLLTETVGRRRADALVEICRQAITHTASCNAQGMTKFSLVVGLWHQQLLDLLGTAAIAGGSNLSAAAARRMACDAHILPAVYGAESEPLDYGRSMRTVAAGLARTVHIRDGGCTFPNCDLTPARSEMHHRKHWLRDFGPTSEENIDSLCSFHHHLVHEGGWTMTIANDVSRTPWFHPPNGAPPQEGKRNSLLHRHDYPKRT